MIPPKGTENDVDEILPGLFLGNEKSSYNKEFLKKYNIKYIIRIMPEFDFTKQEPKITYYHIPIKDSKSCNDTHVKNLSYNYFFKYVINLIHNLMLRRDGNILVHCKRGHHRSASAVSAYLVKYYNLSYQQSVTYIKKIRPFSLRKNSCIMNELYKFCLANVK